MFRNFIAILFCINGALLHAQPDPRDFTYRYIRLSVRAGSADTYTHFRFYGDSFYSERQEYFPEDKLRKAEENFSGSQTVTVKISAIQSGNEAYAFHFLNSTGKDVFVYLYLPSEPGFLFDFGIEDTLIIGQTDLDEGTYLFSWGDEYLNLLAEGVKEAFKKRQDQLKEELRMLRIDAAYEKLQTYMKRCEKADPDCDSIAIYKKELHRRNAEAERLQLDFLNDNEKFLGYFTSTSVKRLADPEVSLMSPMDDRFSTGFTVSGTSLLKARITSEAVPPENLIHWLEETRESPPDNIRLLLRAFRPK